MKQHEICSTTTAHCRTETTDLQPNLNKNSWKTALVLKKDMTRVIAMPVFLDNSGDATTHNIWHGPVHLCVRPLCFAYGQERLEIGSWKIHGIYMKNKRTRIFLFFCWIFHCRVMPPFRHLHCKPMEPCEQSALNETYNRPPYILATGSANKTWWSKIVSCIHK